MGRDLRPVGAGLTYHLMARGNRRQPIFLDDDDRRAFLRMLSRVCERYGWRCYAYCLMGNHFHLAVETPEPNLPDGMRHLLGRYAWIHNQSHGTADHLFRTRYLSVVVDTDEQLLAVIRYISRNPLRGGLVKKAEQWQWGSYPALLGLAQPLRGFDPGETLQLFHPRVWMARVALRGLVEDSDPRKDRWPIVSLASA